MAKQITSLNELSPRSPTTITADTEILIDGCYPDFDGNTLDACAKGARLTLRHVDTDARLRDMVIG